jgi:hypothetical protein
VATLWNSPRVDSWRCRYRRSAGKLHARGESADAVHSRAPTVVSPDEERAYGCAYRIVSADCRSFQLAAETNRAICSFFRLHTADFSLFTGLLIRGSEVRILPGGSKLQPVIHLITNRTRAVPAGRPNMVRGRADSIGPRASSLTLAYGSPTVLANRGPSTRGTDGVRA